MKLTGERLYLRESTFQDCLYFTRWEQCEAITKYLTIDRDRDYEQVVTEYVKRLGDPSQFQMTICLREKEIPIGRIHISRIDPRADSLDLTRIYIGDQDLQGHGYGKEALRLALRYAFEEKNCERVTLDYFTGNERAAGLYRKLGFQEEGVMRHAGKKDGYYVDFHLMSFLRKDYAARFNMALSCQK